MAKHLVTIAAGLLIAAGACAQAPDLERMDIVLKSLPDGPLAKVEGTNIGRQEFVRLYQKELDRISGEGGLNNFPDNARAQLAMEVLRVLIERALLYNEATRLEMTVPEESVLKAWDAQLAQLQQQLPQKEGRELTEEEVLLWLGYRERGEVLADLNRALITEKMFATVVREGGLEIEDAEIEKAYDAQSGRFKKASALHIKQLYFNPEKDSAQKGAARERAEDARGRLFAGQSFEAVARVASDAPDAERGGDMGMLAAHKLPPFMVEIAMSMEPGDISEIIESQFGLHVISLVAKQEASETTLAEAGPLIRRGLLKQRGARTVFVHCEALIRDGAEVKLFLELEKNLELANRSLRP